MKYLQIPLLSLALCFISLISMAETDSLRAESPSLKVLSWNIYMLPKVVPRKGKSERAYAIVEELKKKDFDIIVFQEAFLPKARAIIEAGLEQLFPYHYGPANNEGISIKTNSGVWVISKIPLTIQKTIQFKDSKGFDWFARKGAMLLEGEHFGRKFQIIGTHLQADDQQAIRFMQMDEIYTGLVIPCRQENVPQIICGDMNTESDIKQHYGEMLECFDAEDGEFFGLEKCTYDGVNNDIAKFYGAKKKISYDYVLLRKNGSKLRSIERRVQIMTRRWHKNHVYLSDHYAVECEVKF